MAGEFVLFPLLRNPQMIDGLYAAKETFLWFSHLLRVYLQGWGRVHGTD